MLTPSTVAFVPVAPSEKNAARERLAAFLRERGKGGPEIAVRINPLSGEWGADDLKMAGEAEPDAILLPKVDTPRDIGCARAYGARAIAVATGWHTLEDLAAHGPDHAFPDLADVERALAAMLAR